MIGDACCIGHKRRYRVCRRRGSAVGVGKELPRMRLTFALALVVGLSLVVTDVQGGGKFNKKIKVGDAAPTYTSLPGTDGKSHALADLKGKDVVVVVITCNHCPVAVAYEDRILDFAKKYTAAPNSKVALVAINVNNSEADGLPKMKERAKAKGFTFPYLHDESQKIGRQLGATVTPEFFVLDKERKVVYMGAMDDNMNPSKVKTNYLEPAVGAALKGQTPAVSETRGFGCGIQYQRSSK
jgi:peroxiredoxin